MGTVPCSKSFFQMFPLFKYAATMTMHFKWAKGGFHRNWFMNKRMYTPVGAISHKRILSHSETRQLLSLYTCHCHLNSICVTRTISWRIYNLINKARGIYSKPENNTHFAPPTKKVGETLYLHQTKQRRSPKMMCDRPKLQSSREESFKYSL